MSPRLAAVALAAVMFAATAEGCGQLPDGVPTAFPDVPDVPTELPTLPDIPTDLPDIPTDLPDVPTQLPDLPTALPDIGDNDETPEAAPPAPDAVAPSAPVSEEPLPAEELEDDGALPWWVWLLLAVALVGLVTGLLLLRRSRQREAEWQELWRELTTEARWIDERVVPSVQDRGVSALTAAGRWAEGRRRLESLDRRVYDEAAQVQDPGRGSRLDELSAALLGIRDAVDTEIDVREGGAYGGADDDPRLYAASQSVAAARDELRRVLAGERLPGERR